MEFVRGEEPNNQEGTKIHSFHDFCQKPSLDLSENEYYCEILGRQKSNHQAVPEQDDDTMLQHSSSSNYYFEDPSRFVVRSGEKSRKLSKEVEFTVPDEQSAAVGSSYFDEEISGRMYGSASSDSTYLSDDCEEDSYGFTREVPSLKSSGLKRKRNAEAHSLCEKRRREKVNKKIRALRQLIPNCDKPDQASVLDKAIQYLKTLQLQLQMMSMATRFYMRPFMPQLGIQNINPKPYFNGFYPMDMAMLIGQGYKNNPLIHGFVSMASSAQTSTANPSASAHFHLPSFMDFHQQQIYPDFVNYTESLSSLKNRNSCQEGNEKLKRSCLGEKK